MRSFLIIVATLLVIAPIRAAEWPPAIERYEALALQKPKSGAAMWQLWRYAEATGRVPELKARWEEKAAQPGGHKHRLLLAFLATLQNDFDAAHAQYSKAIEAAPNDSAAWALKGKLEATRGLPQARASLEKAAELEGSDGSNPAASELGAWLLKNGQAADARRVLDRGVAKAHNPEGWLTFTFLRAQAALAEGRLPELIAQVEAAPPGPLGGAELAEIYHMMWDYGQFQAEIERARKLRPDDALVRRQALKMARTTRRQSEVIRLLGEEVKSTPTPETRREYFRALLAGGKGEDARAVLTAQGASLFADPGDWWADVSALHEAGLASSAADLLATAAKEGQWESALLRGQLLLTEKKWEPARESLWSILDPARDSRPFVDHFHEWKGATPQDAQNASIAGVLTAERLMRIGNHQRATHAFSPGGQLETGNMGPVDTLQDARDLAILYLAMASAETGTEKAFLDELDKRTAAWTPAERLFAFVIVRQPARALTELAALSNAPRDRIVDRFCGNLLGTLRTLPLDPAEAQRAAALAGKFPAPEPPPRPDYNYATNHPGFPAASKAFRAGQFEEGWKRFAEAATALRWSGSSTDEQDIATQASFLVTDLSFFRGNASQVALGASVALRATYPESRERGWGGDVRWTLEALYPTLPNLPRNPGGPRVTGRSGGSDASPPIAGTSLLYPPANLIPRNRAEVMARVFHLTQPASGGNTQTPSVRGEPVWPALKKQLDMDGLTLPGDEAFFARVTAAYFAWWNVDIDDALARMRKLFAETNDPGVCLGLAAMLHERADLAAASKVLADAAPPVPASARFVKLCRMRLAAEAGDGATAKALATELAEAPWAASELPNLARYFQLSGAPEAAATMQGRIRAAALQEDTFETVYAALQENPTEENKATIATLAGRWLAPVPHWRMRGFRNYALDALKSAGGLESYAARTAQASAAAPASGEAWSRLAEVSAGPEAIAAWRKVLELEPENLQAVLELHEKAPKASEEQARMVAKVLVGNPREIGALAAEPDIAIFQKAAQLPRLARCIAEAPAWKGVTWMMLDQRRSTWLRFVTAMAATGDRDSTTLVMRKMLEVLAPAPAELRRKAIDHEVACGRAEEAGRMLVDLVLAESEPPLLFAWEATPLLQYWQRKFTSADLVTLLPSVKLAPESQARLAPVAARSETARAVSLLARVIARDATVLPEVEAFTKRATPSSRDGWTSALTAELAKWPTASDTYRKVLAAQGLASRAPTSVASSFTVMKQTVDAALQLAESGDNPGAVSKVRPVLADALKDLRSSNNRVLVTMAGNVAIAAKDEGLMAEITGKLREQIEAQTARGDYVDYTEALKWVDALAAAKRTADARPIIAAFRQNPKMQNRADLPMRFAAFDMEDAIQRGEWQVGTPVVWVDTDRSVPERTLLAWDLALPVRESGSRVPRLVVRGAPVPGGEGKLTVELYYGETADSMELLARIENTGTRGSWSGKLPATTGVARAIISQGDRSLIGETIPIQAAANLLRAADAPKFTPQPPTGEMAITPGGPASDGQYLSYNSPDLTVNRQDIFAVSARLPIRPGFDYTISGWIRQRRLTSGAIGWRCFDQQGVAVGNSWITMQSGCERLWNRGTYTLSTPGGNTRHGRVPENAAFIEIVARGTPDVAGLSIIEVSSNPQEE